MLEKIKQIGTNARPYLTVLIIILLIYNIVVVPVFAAHGVLLPILVLDEATKFLLLINSMGA